MDIIRHMMMSFIASFVSFAFQSFTNSFELVTVSVSTVGVGVRGTRISVMIRLFGHDNSPSSTTSS